MTLTLYDYPLSSECYRVRLLMALLGVAADVVPVDAYPGREHRSEAFLAINAFGTIPVLADGDLTLADSSAILAYLARRFDGAGTWFPAGGAAGEAQVLEWLGVASKLDASAGAARAHDMLGEAADIDAARVTAKELLRRIDQHLAETGGFLAGADPTIADLACFSVAALAPDGGIELDFYPHIQNWMHAIRSLEGFIEMPGIHPLHESPDPFPAANKQQTESA